MSVSSNKCQHCSDSDKLRLATRSPGYRLIGVVSEESCRITPLPYSGIDGLEVEERYAKVYQVGVATTPHFRKYLSLTILDSDRLTVHR